MFTYLIDQFDLTTLMEKIGAYLLKFQSIQLNTFIDLLYFYITYQFNTLIKLQSSQMFTTK